MAMDKHLEVLELATTILSQANIAVPVIFGTVAAISAIIRGATGSGPSPAVIADLIDAQLGANDPKIRAEIARLKSLLG